MKWITFLSEMLDIYCTSPWCRIVGTSSETNAKEEASAINTRDMLFMYLKNFYFLNKQRGFILILSLPSHSSDMWH